MSYYAPIRNTPQDVQENKNGAQQGIVIIKFYLLPRQLDALAAARYIQVMRGFSNRQLLQNNGAFTCCYAHTSHKVVDSRRQRQIAFYSRL